MLDNEAISINRLKGRISGEHRLQPDEVKALKELQQIYPDSALVFHNKRGG